MSDILNKTIVEKVPPHNLEAEEAVLGSILIDNEAMIKIADIVEPEDFYKGAHKVIMEAMVGLYKKRLPIDILSLSNKLDEVGALQEIGGRSYLVGLANAVPTSANIATYANIVQKKSTLRKLIQSATSIVQLGFEEGEEVDKILDQSEQALFQVSQKQTKQNFVSIQNILSDAFERIDELHKDGGQSQGIKTGYTELDGILGGFHRSDLVILAARPSMGKTSLALDIGRQVAKQGIPVGVFSLEMSKEQLVDRMLCAEADVDLWKMRTGNLSDNGAHGDFPRIGHAMGVLSEIPLYIDDGANCNIMEIRTKCRRLQMEHGLGMIIIDYLQLMEGRKGGGESRVQEVAEISRSLKHLARELNVPVIALSQLSRAVENLNPPIPKLSHLRESGSIEQDADVVMFVYREDYYKKDTPRKGITDVIIAKHRNGPVGQVELYFDQAKASFKNLDKRMSHSPPPPEAF
jgi:replicative DNA helicase